MSRKKWAKTLARTTLKSREDYSMISFAVLRNGSRKKVVKADGLLWTICLN